VFNGNAYGLSSCLSAAESNIPSDIPPSSVNRSAVIFLKFLLRPTAPRTLFDVVLPVVPGRVVGAVKETEKVENAVAEWNALRRWSREFSLRSDSLVSVSTLSSERLEGMDKHRHKRAGVETLENGAYTLLLG
jgi:hypothetical protein